MDMADLLRDNLEADWHWGKDNEEASPSRSSRPTSREVPNVLSWAQGFCIHIAVVAEKQPEQVKQLLAYQATVLWEVRRCGGQGWRAYDAVFRQLAAANPSADWSQLNLALYATTFLAHQGKDGKLCTLCMVADHTSEECALSPLQPKSMKSGPSSGERGDRQGAYPSSTASARDPRARQRADQTCYAWNEGRCHFPMCQYRHVCLQCRGEHPAMSCTGAPPNPLYWVDSGHSANWMQAWGVVHCPTGGSKIWAQWMARTEQIASLLQQLYCVNQLDCHFIQVLKKEV